MSFALLIMLAGATDAPSEYPKVVHRDGNVCVQELDGAGTVQESCRPEKDGLRLSQTRSSARLMPGAPLDDPKGASRGVGELAGGIIGATVPILILSATAGSLPTVTSTIVGGLLSVLVAGVTTWILHSIFEGQAGIGWAIVGALAGGAVATLVGLVMTLTSPVALITSAVLGILLPGLGAAIAIEARDGALRRGEVSTLGPRPGVMVAEF